MKRFAIIILLACTLAGCQEQINSAEEKSVSELTAESEQSLENTENFMFEDTLTDEERQILSDFLPILTEGKTFMAAHMPYAGESADQFEEKSLYGILEDIDPEYRDAEYFSDKLIRSVAFCDVTGDGQKELAVLLDHPAGFYCLFHIDGDNVYGIHMPVRWFEGLCENGVFFGSGGAATAYYERLRFSDGAFSTELLGYADMGYYEVNGKEVSQEEFEAWLGDTLAEKAIWHDTLE